MFRRESGIVLHPTCLPGPYGIGEIGAGAEAFINQLEDMGQHLWQVLPLGPTSYGDSPYSGLSSFAGNHLMLSLDRLVEDGLLDPSDLADYPSMDENRVDFGYVIHVRKGIYAKLCAQFPQRAGNAMLEAFDRFVAQNTSWLEDYALFVALKDSFAGREWTQWPKELVRRDPDALARARKDHAAAMNAVRILQYLFDRQWQALRSYCHQRDIRIIGDLPIFVAHDSADVWADAELFFLNEDGNPTVIAGVPPDYFSETGQRWGNPLYRWDLMKERGYLWWKRRMGRTLEMVDIVRIDHFRGFESYWEIRATEETAINGTWVPGPGLALFEAFKQAFGSPAIIAEDLGLITPEVEQLRDATGYPGMKILQFTFGERPIPEDKNPDFFKPNTVCYSGTHDNNTTRGWFQQLKTSAENGDEDARRQLETVLEHLGTSGEEIHTDMIRRAWTCPSNTALAPLQDLLGLGSECRLNFPGKSEGNWQWRFTADQLTARNISWLRNLTDEAGRNHR